jgi:outer membrane protein TolC
MENLSTSSSSGFGGNSGGMSGMNMGNKPATEDAANSSSGRTGGSTSNNVMSMGGGSSGMSEVLRIQLEVSELESNVESVLSEIQAEKVRFNALLNRPIETGIVVPDSMVQIPFSMDEEMIMSLITERNPMLGMINEELLAYGAKVEMDRKMSYPMFGIGVQYMLIAKSSASGATMDENAGHSLSPSMNGKDMIMPMLSVSIPIFRGKYKALRRETDFLRRANVEKYNDALNMLRSELYRYRHLLNDAARRIVLYREQTELVQMTFNIVLKEFVSGTGDLSDIIQVQRQLLDYRLKTAEAVAEYNTGVAAIQKLISTTID